MSAGDRTLGRRVDPGDERGVLDFEPGDYGFWKGHWIAQTPGAWDANLEAHQVTEHEDGTITISPSILVRGGGRLGEWHGYLERGVWREV